MVRQEIISKFYRLRYPIVTNIVVFDDGCEFCVLAQNKGFRCFVGGAFPIIGPNILSAKMHEELRKLLKNKYGDETENKNFYEEDSLWEIVGTLGEDALKEMFDVSWPPSKAFYVYHDMGRGESAFFPSLYKAYRHLIAYCTGLEDGIPWDSMSNDELGEWMELFTSWRLKSPRRLLPREYLGAYYCAGVGSGWAGVSDE